MAIPSATHEQVLSAIARFDEELNQRPELANWQENKAHKYAIRYNGQLYPVKRIIELATGQPVEEFSGGIEAITFIKNVGFSVEPLRLPTQTEVKLALHDLLLTKYPSELAPTDAYRLLGDSFDLSNNQRTMVMENSDESHWENRVRQARRDLVDEQVIDNSEHGVWRLRIRPSPRWWIEKSFVTGRPDRESGEHRLGNALWSPTRARDGRDSYQNMRLVQPGDHVIHLVDNQRIVGVSTADAFARPGFVGILNTDWAGLPGYRIQLRDYQPLKQPIERNEFFQEPSCRAELTAILQKHHGLFYTKDLDLNQGGYLTEAPVELVAIFNRIYGAKTGEPLPGFETGGPDATKQLNSNRLNCQTPCRHQLNVHVPFGVETC
jgi:hypothetical protein